MRLVEYIKTQRGVNISRQQAELLIKIEHKDAYNGLVAIYRGVDRYKDYVYINPSKTKELRVSANTGNYYTLIMDNSQDWKSYPKRSRSLVCTTDSNYADSFGEIYRVYPINGANIGVCPGQDIWEAGNLHGYNFESITNYISMVIKPDVIKQDYVDSDYKTMSKTFKLIDKKKDEILKFMLKHPTTYGEYYTPFFKKYLSFGKTFMEFIEFLLSPKLCEFKLIKAGMAIPGKHEVWTDAPCILVKVGTPDLN